MKPLGAEDIDGGVLSRLHAVVDDRPDATALSDASGTTSFSQLAAAAADVRDAVLDALAGTAPADDATGAPAALAGREPVAVLMGHDRAAVGAVFGVIATGHPVLVLDPLTPPARLRQFTRRAGARLCVADADREAAAREVAATVVAHGRIPARAAAGDLWTGLPDPRSPAVVGFTSGSTGNPKLVLVDHRQMTSDAWLNATCGECYGADDVVAHTLPMAFNAGVCLTLAGPQVGCRMALYDVRTSGIEGLARWVDAEGVTVAHASPAILRRLVQAGPDPARLAGLRVLTVAGEPVHGRDVEAARALLPRTCTIHNRYGSSETGLIAEYRVTGDHPPITGPLPAGRPLGPTRVTLLGSDGTPVPDGEPGTIAVTRGTVAMGYDDPLQTAGVFCDDAAGTRTCRTSDIGRFDTDGLLHLLGRRDHSVKIRGYLVEPGEVDAALFALPEVREAVVVGSPRPEDGTMRLVAYVVPAGESLGAATVRAALRETLPAHMVPEAVVFLDALPRTDRGKLDRSALPPAPVARAGSAGQELSEWEMCVADVMARVLSLEDVGLDDDFFELGGDSLAAERLMSSLVQEFGAPSEAATTSTLVQAPTVRHLARLLTRRPASDEVLVPLRENGSRPPLYIVAGGGGLGVAFVPVARHLDDDQPVWAFQARGMERRGIPDWSVRRIARRNVDALLRRQPAGPYHLAGHSFGGLVALEMAHRLRNAGHEVALLVLLDSFPPDPAIHPSRHGSWRQRLKDAVGIATTGIRGTPGMDRYWRFFRLSEVMHRRYRTTPWPGEAVVVVAETPERDLRAAWDGHLSGNWRLVEVAGDHMSMIRDPYAADLAALLADALRSVTPATAGVR